MRAILVETVTRRRMKELRGRGRVMAAAYIPERIVYIRLEVGRWLPSFRRFVLWHEWAHFRLREKSESRWPHRALDFANVMAFIPWWVHDHR